MYSLQSCTFPIFLVSALTLAGCGGSGGGGPATATIDDANKLDLAIAGAEGARQAANGDTAGGPLGFKGANPGTVRTMLKDIASARDAAYFQDLSSFCTTGTASININEQTGNGSFSYGMCDFGGVTIDGTGTINSTISGSIVTTSVNVSNFTITYGGETQTVSYSVTCTLDTNATFIEPDCSFNSSGVGIDGRTYAISNAKVTGSALSGFDVQATVTDPEHGVFTIDTGTPITFNCSDGLPDNGQITVTAGATVMTVTFDSCTRFTVTFEGNAELIFWADLI